MNALAANKNGIGDTAVGFEALERLQLVGFGSEPTDNIALGHGAGSNLRSGLRNIYIGSLAGGSNLTVDEENFTIRIGRSDFHFATFIAGIYNLPDGG